MLPLFGMPFFPLLLNILQDPPMKLFLVARDVIMSEAFIHTFTTFTLIYDNSTPKVGSRPVHRDLSGQKGLA